MTYKKPTPILGDHGKVCPVCGTRSYSANGIHPQCAMLQADAPREERLKEERKKKVKKKVAGQNEAKPVYQKTCPRCRKEMHVRKKTCECGFAFIKP